MTKHIKKRHDVRTAEAADGFTEEPKNNLPQSGAIYGLDLVPIIGE